MVHAGTAYQLCVVFVCALYSVCSVAGPGAGRFSIGTYLGLHQPAIEDINDGELKSPLAGTATIVDFVSDETSTRPIYFSNPLPPIELGVNAGLEILWRLDDRWHLILGGGSWEASSSASRYGPFAIQGVETTVTSVRSVKLSYTEYYFGVQRKMFDLNPRNKIHYRIALSEMFDIDYQENLLFHYHDGPAAGVNKSILLRSQATGVLALQPGFGWEHVLSKWLSIGIDTTYFIGLRRANLQENGEPRKDFLFSDNLNLWLPQRIGPDGNLQYLSVEARDAKDYRPIKLNFDGWKVLFRLTVNY